MVGAKLRKPLFPLFANLMLRELNFLVVDSYKINVGVCWGFSSFKIWIDICINDLWLNTINGIAN